MTKAYQMGRGILLESNFPAHQDACATCRAYDATRPATAGALCLEGSVLLKADLAAQTKRKEYGAATEGKVSKAKLASLMKYK